MRLFLTLVFLASLSFSSQAAQASHRKFGLAGCGLGSVLFGDNPGVVQTFAATTNNTLGTQTFGITSGTSNCIDPSDEHASLDQLNFTKINLANLSRDIVNGKGEYLAAFLTLLDCPPATQDKFNKTMHAQRKVILSQDASPADVLFEAKRAAFNEPDLAQKCGRI